MTTPEPETPPERGAEPAEGTPDATWKRVLSALWRDRLATAAATLLLLTCVLAVLGEQIAPYDENEIDVARMLEGPSGGHLFGTDELGRDIFSRVLIAARVSVQVGLVSVSIALCVGVVIGLVAGYYRGIVDNIAMRCMDVIFAFPVMLLAVAIVAVLGRGLTTAMIAIAVVYAPIFARITRSSVLSVREEVFVSAAVSIGSSDARIIVRHILPNVAAPIIVQTSLSLAFAILSEAALSFLGLGVQPPQPSWGRMLFDGRGFMEQAWWMGVFPGLAIMLVVLSFNVIGDTLRDALDPRQRSAMEARSLSGGVKS